MSVDGQSHHINALDRKQDSRSILPKPKRASPPPEHSVAEIGCKVARVGIDWRRLTEHGIQSRLLRSKFADELGEAAITPSDSTALAKLLAEERLRMLDKFDSLVSQIKTECLQSSRGTQ